MDTGRGCCDGGVQWLRARAAQRLNHNRGSCDRGARRLQVRAPVAQPRQSWLRRRVMLDDSKRCQARITGGSAEVGAGTGMLVDGERATRWIRGRGCCDGVHR